MDGGLTIRRIRALQPGLRALAAEARAEGFGLMDRFIAAWEDGSNRFDRPGEAYFAVWHAGKIVGAGGLSRDPYDSDAKIGRVRHLYIGPSARRGGAGSALMGVIVERARAEFNALRLRTTTARGSAFYEALGFERLGADDASHILRF